MAMTLPTNLLRSRLGPADLLAVAVAVSLPWSTSAAGILIALWLVALLPTVEVAALRRTLATAAGGFPVLLWVLAAVGMLWADVSWSDCFGGLGGFNRLLAIPLLLAQFRRSEHGTWVICGFFASVTGVLIFSWALVLFPDLPWHSNSIGVPVKDYILQSEEFLICAFAALAIALRRKAPDWRIAAAFLALALLFLANIGFVATGRTTLLVAPVLALLLGWRLFGWRGVGAALLLGGIVAAIVWAGSPYVRLRLVTSVSELKSFATANTVTDTGMHLEFLIKSVAFIESAPVIGHGTGSIAEQFRQAAVGQNGVAAVAAVNPHNQLFAVAIQLGLAGAALLLAVWVAHLMLFRGGGPNSWFGLMVVVENIVSSLFNSHLFDFTQGWLYVFGVGVIGGMVLSEQDMRKTAAGGP